MKALATTCLLLLLLGRFALAEESLHYPAEAGSPTHNALVVHGALDLPYMRPLLEAFHARHPEVALTYRNLDTLTLHQRFLAAPDEADLLISSAMPWQYHLANDGQAQALESDAAAAWPRWARWRQELFAFTFEPVVMVVRRELIERFGRPDSHAALLELLERHGDALRGRVVTYDPRRSGAGYSYAIEEARRSPRYWDLVAALGEAESVLATTTGEMLSGLDEGRYWLGYNLLGSYASAAVAANPALTLVIPSDYTLVTRRLALIPRQAPHPRQARRFLNFLIGEPGQRVIAEATPLGALHPSLRGPGTAEALRDAHGEALRPIPLGPSLLATLDELKRQALLARWRREFSRGIDTAPSP